MLLLLARTARTAARTHIVEQAVRGITTSAAPLQQQGSAASNSKSSEVKLPQSPLQLSGISASIATLTWQIAAKENLVDRVQDELAQLAEAVQELPQLRQLATDPFVPSIVRKKVFEQLLKDSDKVKVTEISRRLLDSLAEENAITALPTVSSIFNDLVLAQKKEVYVAIVTAHPLDKMERAEIHKQAEKFVEPGFKLVAQEKVNKKLQGGFILEFEDRLVDASDSKKQIEFNNMVSRLENDLI